MIPFDEARARLIASARRLPAERVPLILGLGRVLAESLLSPSPLPPFDGSAMDGYAVSTASFAGAGPWTLPVRGESRAGSEPAPLERGAACRIFTGAMVPVGADAVVMQENVRRAGDEASFAEAPRAGAHIRRAGEDLRQGALALASGTRLGPAQLALAATVDRGELLVSRRPVVSLLSTGDELRAPGSAARPGTIPESNGIALAAMAAQAGAIVHVAPVTGDDPDATTRAVEAGLEGADVLVTVGGVSVGDHDVVRPALERAGVALDFWKVAMKPGKPLAIGRRGGTHVLGLPGNPVSALVTFLLFGVPLLRSMAGDTAALAPFGRATLARAVERSPGRTEFVRVTLAYEGDTLRATPLDNQASGALVALASCDALAVLDASLGAVPAGTVVPVLRLGDA